MTQDTLTGHNSPTGKTKRQARGGGAAPLHKGEKRRVNHSKSYCLPIYRDTLSHERSLKTYSSWSARVCLSLLSVCIDHRGRSFSPVLNDRIAERYIRYIRSIPRVLTRRLEGLDSRAAGRVIHRRARDARRRRRRPDTTRRRRRGMTATKRRHRSMAPPSVMDPRARGTEDEETETATDERAGRGGGEEAAAVVTTTTTSTLGARARALGRASERSKTNANGDGVEAREPNGTRRPLDEALGGTGTGTGRGRQGGGRRRAARRRIRSRRCSRRRCERTMRR